MRTAVVGPGDELRSGGSGRGIAHRLLPAGGVVGAQRGLFAFGGPGGAGFADVDQPPAAGSPRRSAPVPEMLFETLWASVREKVRVP